MDNRPIGVFDSGLGGLTVVRALSKLLPDENIVYFGDTGRVPYGTRSETTIKQYAKQDAEFLLSHDVKMIIAACGTVSSVAPKTGDSLPVPFLGVVAPAAKEAVKATKTKKIGILGTSATIKSGAYEREIKALDPNLQTTSTDCPLFVPLVESGWISPDDEITTLTVKRYLKDVKNAGVDTLILGCTHYPLLIPFIRKEMGEGVTLISAGDAAAKQAEILLREGGLCGGEGKTEFFVSDTPSGFSKIASLFLQKEIGDKVTQVDITRS